MTSSDLWLTHFQIQCIRWNTPIVSQICAPIPYIHITMQTLFPEGEGIRCFSSWWSSMYRSTPSILICPSDAFRNSAEAPQVQYVSMELGKSQIAESSDCNMSYPYKLQKSPHVPSNPSMWIAYFCWNSSKPSLNPTFLLLQFLEIIIFSWFWFKLQLNLRFLLLQMA